MGGCVQGLAGRRVSLRMHGNHIWLVIAAIIFGAAHMFMTWQNLK